MSGDLRELCQCLVPQVLTHHDWQLVEEEAAFTEEVLLEAEARLPSARRTREKIVEDATINCYGHLWHAACRANGTLRQRRALEELHRYLYTVSRYYARDNQYIAEECAQESLIDAWQHLDQVKDAGAFMRWANVIAYHHVMHKISEGTQVVENGEETARQPIEISTTDLEPRDGDTGRPEIMPVNEPVTRNEPMPVMTKELRVKLETAIKHCLPGQQPAVIIGLFLDDKTVKEMADELDMTPANVWVLKSRALKKLRECTDFIEVFEELM